MKKSNIFIVLMLILSFSCTKAPQETNDDPISSLLDPQKWPGSCNELKSHYEKDERLYTKYTNKPQKELSNPVWIIHWDGLDVPIPVEAYNHFGGSRSGAENIKALGISNDEITIFLSKPGKYMKPLYESEEFSKRLFKTPSFWEVMKKQYSVTPNDLSCKPETIDADYATAVILSYKRLSVAGDSVYKDLGKYDGWLNHEVRDNIIFWNAEIALSEKPKGAHSIVYSTSKNSRLNDIGLYFGSDLGDNIKPAPQWLELLNKALKTDDLNDWSIFLDSAKRSGFKIDSLNKFAKEIGIDEYKP